MARPKKLIPQIRREVYLPEPISKILEKLFHDPTRNKVRYNAINTYINSLIIDDLTRRGFLPLRSNQNDQ